MRSFFREFAHNISPGPEHVCKSEIIEADDKKRLVDFIAFYLPQFYETEENNLWWGRGFTEWTNVTKALPRYQGQRQPRLPSDLGFYNLTNVDTLHAQARLAKLAGLRGFCIHDYWFNGTKILGKPLELLLKNKDIEIPFCINWANESWSRRWDGAEHEVLIEQHYNPKKLDGYLRSIIGALSDDRYIKINGRPLLMIYRPGNIPGAKYMFEAWREFMARQGLAEPYLVAAQTYGLLDPREYNMDAAVGFPPHGPNIWDRNDLDFLQLLDNAYKGHVRSYDFLAREMLARFSDRYVTFPGVCPSWDNEARKVGNGLSFHGSSPAKFGSWLRLAAQQVIASNNDGERFVFINAWNEWAEGAVLEPDRHHGYAYIKQVRDVASNLSHPDPVYCLPLPESQTSFTWRYLINKLKRRLC